MPQPCSHSTRIFARIALALASVATAPAHAADWRTLPTPAGVQSMIDLDSVSNTSGMQRFLLRREYAEPRVTAGGKAFRSMRVNYDADCPALRLTATLTAYYGDDRRLVHSEQHERVARRAYAPAPAGSDTAEALALACERLAAQGNADKPPVTDGRPVAATRTPRGDTSGSGIVVSEAGHVLTNQHVVQQCDAHEVIDESNTVHKATLLASDNWRDLALLSIDRRSTRVARLRADAEPRLGEAVTVVGYPLVTVLGTKPTVGFGHVSSTVGINDNPLQMQISVPIQRGNSGGPVFDQAGNVIGIVASKLDALKIAESVGDLPQNVNFAIRGEIVRAFLEAQRVGVASSRDTARLENTDIAMQGVAVTVRVRCLRQNAAR